MAKTRKTYTAEFKLQAVRMVADQHLAVAEVARRLGVTEGRLHDWLKAFRAQGPDAFPGHGRMSPPDEELHRLHARVEFRRRGVGDGNGRQRIVVEDRAHALSVDDHRVDRAAQVDEKRLVALAQKIPGDRHGRA